MYYNDILSVNYVDNITKISIKEDCDFNLLNNKLVQNKLLDKFFIHSISYDSNIKRGIIYILEDDNLIFNIYKNNEKMYIIQNDKKEQTIIELNNNDSFSISSKSIDTGVINTYFSNKKELSLDKITAFKLVFELLKNLNNFSNVIDIDLVCRRLNIVQLSNYSEVISDGVISLSLDNKESVNSINNELCKMFNIVLTETKEDIGFIMYDYNCNLDENYEMGNVFYEIWDIYQNNGYATKALGLLKKLLLNNKFQGNKDLYFSVEHNNEFSKKVILNNGGEIIEKENKKPYILKIKI